jgi:hypothetical protein
VRLKVGRLCHLGGPTEWGWDAQVRTRQSQHCPAGAIKSIDYLLTGEITGSGNAYTITARIEAGYSRDVVKTATVRTTGELVQMRAVVNSLADQLRPVSAAITAFEIQKRASNKDVARANPLVKIATDVKTTMLDGERTQATLKMTDCDGFPLASREIGFLQASWPEGRVSGTTGLRLKSSTVVTDASGQARVSIQAQEPGAAQLEAWHRYRKPTGRPDVIVNTRPIKVEPYRFRPILTLTFEESLGGGELKYAMRGKTTFALSFGPDGSQSFDKEALNSEDLYRLRGGLVGLKSGETLNLYALEEDASGTATVSKFPPCTARHLLTRDGRFQSWADGKLEETETWRTYVKDSQRVHGGEVLSATLTRTLDGAIFEYTTRTVRSSGCEYLSSPLWTHGFTAREKSAGLASFTLSEAQVADLGQLQQTRQGMLENTAERNLGPSSITLKVTLSGAQ